jgi:uroporphyrinogen-III synthase
MLRMEPINPEIPDRHYRGVVLTSANAARAIAAHPLQTTILALPVLAVGKHTADSARAAGFREIRSADGDNRDLLRLLKNEPASGCGPYLYLAGEERSVDLTQTMNVVTAVVYRMTPIERFAPIAESALRAGQVDGVMHFSTRSARAYLHSAMCEQMLASALAPVQFCLSAQVAAPLRTAGTDAIRIAGRPDEAALIDLLSEPAARADSH